MLTKDDLMKLSKERLCELLLEEWSKKENPSDECPCCGWALDSDGCCSSCGYGRK